MAYNKQTMPANLTLEQLAKWVDDEFVSLQRQLQTQDFILFTVTNVAPTRPSAGMIAFADGTNWNPGSGRGLYQYKTSSWVAL